MKSIIALFATVLLTTSCAFMEKNIQGIASGGVAIASAPVVQKAIERCVLYDATSKAALKAPAEFFKVGYDVITKRGADIPIITLIEESPAYYKDIPDQWDSIWAVLDKKDCGPVVAQWRANSEAAFDTTKKIVAQKDRLARACNHYNAYAPIAALFSPIPLPRTVPGCS